LTRHLSSISLIAAGVTKSLLAIRVISRVPRLASRRRPETVRRPFNSFSQASASRIGSGAKKAASGWNAD
jgi:hypothetical protein